LGLQAFPWLTTEAIFIFVCGDKFFVSPALAEKDLPARVLQESPE
jgi:hypothetical protein